MNASTTGSLNRGSLLSSEEVGWRDWPHRDPAGCLLSILLTASALFTILTMAEVVRRAYSPLPWGDMWDYWRWYLAHHHNLTRNLFLQHNEHRIAVARLFFLIDQKLFHGLGIFIYVCIFIIQLTHGALITLLAYISQPGRKTAFVSLSAAAFICLFSATQYTNFTWSFQIQFVAVYLSVTAALILTMFAATAASYRWLIMVGAIFTGIIATYSMANGLFVWPMLVLEAFWLGMTQREKILLGVASLTMWLLYLWHYTSPPHHTSPREALHHLTGVFLYSVTVIGSPIAGLISQVATLLGGHGEDWGLGAACIVGFGGFLFSTYMVVVTVQHWTKEDRAGAVTLCSLLFLLITVGLIGMGRVNFPIRDALQSRYCTPALLLWYFSVFSFVSSRQQTITIVACCRLLQHFAIATGFLIILVLYQPTQLRYASSAVTYQNESAAAISAPVYAQDYWKRVYYDSPAIIPVVNFLRTNHLTIFARDEYRWSGDLLRDHFTVADVGRCSGAVDDLQFVTGPELPGFQIQGWAWDDLRQKVPKSIVFSDENNRIIGFGFTGYDREDVRTAKIEVGSAGVGWIGFIPGLEHERINAYAVLNKSIVCRVGSRTTQQFHTVSLKDVGPEIESVGVTIQGEWRNDGYYPTVERPTGAHHIVGSWIKGDGDIGTVRIGPFNNRKCHTLVFPIVTGPSSSGLSVQIIDLNTGKAVAALAPPPVTTKWEGWKVSFPRNDMRIQLLGQDQGTGWGQWMAVGFPRVDKETRCQ